MGFSRDERFERIRSDLLDPKPQRPGPELIISKMFQVEQTLNLRLANTGQPWALVSHSFSSVIGQTEYEIPTPVSGAIRAGKIYSAFRSTGNDRLPFVAIETEDFSQQTFGKMPLQVNDFGFAPEKISVYRSDLDNQKLKIVLQPTPTEVLNYTLYFHAGALDRAEALMTDEHSLPELMDYLDLKTELILLPACEWQGFSPDLNFARRKELRESLLLQIADLEPIVDQYIDQIAGPQTFEMGHWND